MKQEIADLDALGSERTGCVPKKRLVWRSIAGSLDKILVLPGFELTATFGFHIIWPSLPYDARAQPRTSCCWT